MKAFINALLHARQGPMTGELKQGPAHYRLGMLPARLAPASIVQSTCGFCSTGCSLKIHLDDKGRPLNLSADTDYPVNRGMACPKGWEALTPLAAPDRGSSPLLRNPDTGKLEPCSWETAIATLCSRFKGLQSTQGPDSLAILSTGQIVMEEMALLGVLARSVMGIQHLDSNTRQCMATAHVAYRQSFGFDAPPFSYADFEESDVLVFVGANPCIAHPIMWQRVMKNQRKPLIIVIDPRRTETAMQAQLHLPLRPKSDLVLLYGLASELIATDRLDHAFLADHCEGTDELKAFLKDYPLSRAAEESGLPLETLRKLAEVLGDPGKRISYWWTMGVNQSHQSTRTAQALINLALLTGQIGKPGTGANSITGQCNAMGSRLFGNSSTLLGGHEFADEAQRAKVASILGLDTRHMPAAKSIAYDQIMDGIDSGEIRGLWVIATNPAHSWVHQNRFHELRRKLDFLVVQDMYHSTEVAQMADLVLPAAGWGEKEGTFINSERRISVIRKVCPPPGQALSDFAIFRLIGEAWGGDAAKALQAWSTPEAAFGLLRDISRGQPADFTGIRGYDHLQQQGGIQWPWTEADAARGEPSQERRLFSDGRFYTRSHKAKLLFDTPRPLPEPTDENYPLWLNTGRGSSAQWHTGSRTNKSAVLRKLSPSMQIVEINPADAKRLGIADSQRVRVLSRRGHASALAVVTEVVSPGQIFMPMHFPEMNRLTFPAYDPHSRQPAYKACAVRLEAE